jgi:ATP adenylyltransferase
MQYVGGRSATECVFCAALDAPETVDSLMVHEGDQCFVLMNLYPYTTGHLMILPKRHLASLSDLDDVTNGELLRLAALMTEVAQPVLRCDGFNLGLNLGSAAGAGIVGHLHLHLVPRWIGDANFMPVIGETMVLPELLPVTRARLRAELETKLAARDAGLELVAGAVPYVSSRGTIALRRSKTGDIVVPKGHIEPSETAAQAAIREVREETGLDARITGWLGSEFIHLPGGRRQHAVYFLAEAAETAETRAHEGLDTLFVLPGKAAGLIRFPELRGIVERAVATVQRRTEGG